MDPLVLLFPGLLDGLAAHERVQPPSSTTRLSNGMRSAGLAGEDPWSGRRGSGHAESGVRLMGRSEKDIARRRLSDLPKRVERGRPHSRRLPRRPNPLAEGGNGFAVSLPAETYRRSFTDRGQRILQQDQENVSDLSSSPARERLDKIDPLRFRKARVLRLNRQSLEGRTGVGQRRAPARRGDNRDEKRGQKPIHSDHGCMLETSDLLVCSSTTGGPSRPG